jgi:hypothetical protein
MELIWQGICINDIWVKLGAGFLIKRIFNSKQISKKIVDNLPVWFMIN